MPTRTPTLESGASDLKAAIAERKPAKTERRVVSFDARSPETAALVAELRKGGARPHVVIEHPDGWRTIVTQNRPPFSLPPYRPIYAAPKKKP